MPRPKKQKLNQTVPDWDQCKTFEQLQNRMRNFLKSEERFSIWTSKDDDTNLILDDLLQINTRSMMTMEYELGYKKEEKEIIKERKRAYVELLVTNELLPNLLSELSKTDKFIAVEQRYDGRQISHGNFDDIVENGYINILYSSKEEDICNMAYPIKMFDCHYCQDVLEDYNKDLYTYIQRKITHLLIIEKEYGSNELFPFLSKLNTN